MSRETPIHWELEGEAPVHGKDDTRHHVVTYKGHKLSIVRVRERLWPDEPHSELVTRWEGQVDGVTVPGIGGSHDSPVGEALLDHVDALPA